MKKIFFSILSITVILNSVDSYAAPSFNCKNAKTEIEKRICTSDELGALDVQQANLYKKILEQTPSAEKSLIKNEQQAWIKKRDQACKGKAGVDCLKSSYNKKIADQEHLLAVYSSSASAKPENLGSTSDMSVDKTQSAWKLLGKKPADYSFSEFFSKGGDSHQYVLLGIENETHEVLIGFFTEEKGKLSLQANTTEDFSDEAVEPSESVLSDVSLDQSTAKNKSGISILANYTFDSTSTHCGTTMRFDYVLKGSELVRKSKKTLKHSCE